MPTKLLPLTKLQSKFKFSKGRKQHDREDMHMPMCVLTKL